MTFGRCPVLPQIYELIQKRRHKIPHDNDFVNT